MSIQSEFLYFMMKNRHLFQFRLKPETWDENTSVAAFRELAEASNRKMENMLPEGLQVSAFDLAGMHAEWLIPAGANKEKMILYTIGGGYISGTCSDHRTLVAKVAQTSGFAILMFDHRLAPEHPYPAALEDSLTAYRWLLGRLKPATAEQPCLMEEFLILILWIPVLICDSTTDLSPIC